jgi:hypothetical protein
MKKAKRRPPHVMGPPLIEWKRPGVVEKIRARLEQGESYRKIMKDLDVGNSVIARVRRMVKAEVTARHTAAREALIAKLMETGLSKDEAEALLTEGGMKP